MSKKRHQGVLLFAGQDAKDNTIYRRYKKTGRNDECPCGSGRKYKNCCLALGKYSEYRYNRIKRQVTPEADLKRKMPWPFEVGETVVGSKAFPVEAFRGRPLVITARGFEEAAGNFYFKVRPESDPMKLVNTGVWYADGHLEKPEYYGKD